MTRRALRAAATVGAAALIALAGCSAQPQATTSAADESQAAETQSGAAQSDETKTVASKGDTVKVHYRGTLDDGTQFDSSYDRDDPLEFTVGSGQMIAGFDAAVEGMKVGDKKTVHLEPADAYGEHDESLVRSFPKDEVPEADSLAVGDTVYLNTSSGQVMPAEVTAIDDDTVIVDANHRLAGKPLNFEIELMSVE